MNPRPLPIFITRGVALGAALLAGGPALPTTSNAARLGPSASPVATGPVPDTSEPASEATPSPVVTTSGPVRVTVEGGVANASLMPQWITEKNPNVGRALALPGHEQWVDVTIVGATYDYRVTITPMRDGTPIGPAPEPVPCACNDDELLALVGKELAIAVERAQSTPAEPVEPQTEPEEPQTESEVAPRGKPDPRLTGLGIGGIVTGVLGVGAIVGGAAMIVVHERPVGDSLYPYFVRDFQPLGFATVSVGVAALAAGTTMLALDLTRCRRRPSARGCPSPGVAGPAAVAPRRVRVSAAITPETTGVSLHGRF